MAAACFSAAWVLSCILALVCPLLTLGRTSASTAPPPASGSNPFFIRAGGSSTKLEGLTKDCAPPSTTSTSDSPVAEGKRLGPKTGSEVWDWWNPKDPPCKFVVVTGGVISGIGKGVTASSVGLLLKMMNFRPTAIKIDPYLNVDAGTMSPFEHGEVFVLDDGGETDLDLGNYERFLNVRLTNDSNLTTGKVYQAVIEKERRGDYLGKTVQVVPHITNEIQEWILRVAQQPVDDSGLAPNVCVIELGGTLGDIESMPFVEALRQLQDRVGYKNCCFLHVSMVPIIGDAPGEQKTKPTQHSVKEMRALGLIPDLVVCRSQQPLLPETRSKLAMFCQVPEDHVLSVHDVSNIFRVPLLLMHQGVHTLLYDRLRLHLMKKGWGPTRHQPSLDDRLLSRWNTIADTVDDRSLPLVKIAVVGKYTGLKDSYLSIHKALQHSAMATRQQLDIIYIDSSELDVEDEDQSDMWKQLRECHGILVPGGFGNRGLGGKVRAIQYARTHHIPFLGICLGMQAAVIEYARHILNRPGATSTEFSPTDPLSLYTKPTKNDVIIFMPEGDKARMGGTMRLGSRTTVLTPGSVAHGLYSHDLKTYDQQSVSSTKPLHIEERHRHRYEVNPDVVEELEAAGLRFVGKDLEGKRMEVLELDSSVGRLQKDRHPFFLGVQYHPEFKSRPTRPSPVFLGFLTAARDRAVKLEQEEEGRQPAAV